MDPHHHLIGWVLLTFQADRVQGVYDQPELRATERQSQQPTQAVWPSSPALNSHVLWTLYKTLLPAVTGLSPNLPPTLLSVFCLGPLYYPPVSGALLF